MKKSIKLLWAALMALVMFVPAQATNQLTVFEYGDYSSNTLPINFVYLDEVGTRSQVIYPAAELAEMTGEVINSMKFYLWDDMTESGGQIKISLGETTQTTYQGQTYVEGLTHVATLSLVEGVREVEIVFDTPYHYNGGNLVFDATLQAVATNYCFISFVGDRPTNYSGISRGEIERFIPKTTFDYGTTAEYSAKVVPGEVTFNTIRAEREDVQTVVLTNNGLNGFTPSFSVDAPFSVEVPNLVLTAGQSVEVPITFAPMAEGTYEGTLTIDCGQAGILEVALHGTAMEAADEVTAGDETDYASFVPIYGTDIDIVNTRGQVIYPANLLTDMVGGKITALKFYTRGQVQMKGGTIQVSLKTVDNTVFAEATPETDLTVVGTVSPVLNSTDLEIFFDEPFEYNGGNLLVECLVTEAGVTNYSPTYFYGTPTEPDNVAIYTSFDFDGMSTYFVPFMPKATFSYQKGEVPPAGMKGDVNGDQVVNITDVTILISAIQNDNYDNINFNNSDMNDDENINITDVTMLINYVLSMM